MHTTVKDLFAIEAFGEDLVALRCAACGEAYLHQQAVRVCFRGEFREGVSAVEVIVDREQSLTRCCKEKNVYENEKLWRDAIIVELSCENCSSLTELIIAQHKGNTFLETRVKT